MRTIKHTMPLREQQLTALKFSQDALTVFELGSWKALRSYVGKIPVGIYVCPGSTLNCPCFGTGYLEVTEYEQ